MHKRLLVCILLFAIPTLGKTSVGSRKTPPKPAAKNPVEAILASRPLTKFLQSKDRYTPPHDLLEKIKNDPEPVKEAKLLKWFSKRDRTFLRKLARWGIMWRSVLLVIFSSLILYFTGNFLWDLGKKILQSVGILQAPAAPAAAGVGAPQPSMLGRAAKLFVGSIPGLGGYADMAKNWVDGIVHRVTGGGAGAMMIMNLLGFLGGGFFSFRYLAKPLFWLWGMLSNVFILLRFSYNPTFKNPLERSEHLYMISYYLFSDPVHRVIENMLLSTRAGDMSKVNEVELLLKYYRALPWGVKHVTYDQDRIDEVFSTYPSEVKDFAEQLIALIVIYTEAMESGREHLFENLGIKGILLYGPPGTGKSNFFKNVCKALDLNAISLMIMDPTVDLRGKTGQKLGLGTASAFAKACLAAADSKGRTYANLPVVLEELDKAMDDTGSHKGNVSAFYHNLLDPKGEAMKDDYLYCNIPKPFFIWATTNYIGKLRKDAEAIIDRFTTFYMQDIPKEYKKKIAREMLIPLWVALLSDEKLNAKYDHYLSQEDVEYILMPMVEKYIDRSDEPGLRGVEDYLRKKSLELMVAAFKEAEDVRRYMRELEAWEKAQAYLEDDAYLDALPTEEKEWVDERFKLGEWNLRLAELEWESPFFYEEPLSEDDVPIASDLEEVSDNEEAAYLATEVVQEEPADDPQATQEEVPPEAKDGGEEVSDQPSVQGDAPDEQTRGEEAPSPPPQSVSDQEAVEVEQLQEEEPAEKNDGGEEASEQPPEEESEAYFHTVDEEQAYWDGYEETSQDEEMPYDDTWEAYDTEGQEVSDEEASHNDNA